MGAFSVKPFGNDAALDWFRILEESTEASTMIENALLLSIESEQNDTCCEEEALAASAIIAAACYEPIKGVPKEIKEWIERIGYAPDYAIILKALNVVNLLLEKSNLKILWDESGSLKSWINETSSISRKLESALNLVLPNRIAKKTRPTKSLYKIVEQWAKNPTHTSSLQIQRKLSLLQDLNNPCQETNYELPLCLLAKHGLLEEVEWLISKGANPNPDTKLFYSPLASACSSGHVKVAELLIRHNAQLFQEVHLDRYSHFQSGDSTIYKYSQALFAAAATGTPEILDYLFSIGCDLHQTDLNGETLLHKAAETGNTLVVIHLIKLGIPVDKGKVGDSEPALYTSIRAKHYQVTSALIEAGANVNTLNTFVDNGQVCYICPLDIAVDYKIPMIVELLVKHGALSSAILVKK